MSVFRKVHGAEATGTTNGVDQYRIEEGWSVFRMLDEEDGVEPLEATDELIAVVETECLADRLLASLNREYNLPDRVGYAEVLDADRQISAEEAIAAYLFDQADLYGGEISEEHAGDAGRDILYVVLREFRPDLFDDAPPQRKPAAGIGTITIEISGGCLTDVSDLPEGWDYKLVDWDNINDGDPHPDDEDEPE